MANVVPDLRHVVAPLTSAIPGRESPNVCRFYEETLHDLPRRPADQVNQSWMHGDLNGANVILAARTVEKLEETQAQIEELGGKAFAYSCDISDLEDCDRFVAKVLDPDNVPPEPELQALANARMSPSG